MYAGSWLRRVLGCLIHVKEQEVEPVLVSFAALFSVSSVSIGVARRANHPQPLICCCLLSLRRPR
jgi:hypothetical protein